MKLTPLEIEGAWVAESPLWGDERGNFREWFKATDVEREISRSFEVKQANISVSVMGVVRGIHYSLAVGGQAKWVTCVNGAIVDYVVDIRPDSPTFKKWVTIDLNGTNGKAVLIGEGLGHAFVSLADASTASYLLTSPYSPAEEFEINPFDSELNIDWRLPTAELLLSAKDRNAPSLLERLADGKLPH